MTSAGRPVLREIFSIDFRPGLVIIIIMFVTKMHGIGNDYVYSNGFEEKLLYSPAVLAQKLASRHFGVGGDGLIIIHPPSSPDADCRMEMYNADGSRAQMCGNGIRCVAKFAYDRGLA